MKRVLTGIKASGKPHLGNYFGAIKPALDLSLEAQKGFFFIADYHALTLQPSSKDFQDAYRDVARTWLACGLDPQKHFFYRQSQVPEIFELYWILSCFTPKGFMNRAHVYKSLISGKKNEDKINMGLYSYPVLMAADILLFSADEVPVGEDQLQHVEFSRDIAQKFNRHYGEVLKIPSSRVVKGKTLLGTDGQKMSKSYNNTIPMFEEASKIRKKIMKIKTDSSDINEPKSTEKCLLFHLFKEVSSDEDIACLKERYEKGIGWGEVKELLFQGLQTYFEKFYKTYCHYSEHPEELEALLNTGAEKARQEAQQCLKDVRKAIGCS